MSDDNRISIDPILTTAVRADGSYGYQYYDGPVYTASTVHQMVSFKVNGLNHSLPQDKALRMLSEMYSWEELAAKDENFAKHLEHLRLIYKLSFE